MKLKDLLYGTALSVGLTAGTFGPAGQALAQEVDQTEDQGDRLREIIVTAERRAESLQRVAAAVTAFDEGELQARQIDTLTELSSRTPSLSMGTFNVAQPQLFIRGIGSNDDGPGADASVVVFVDEVYIGRPAATSFDLFDLERVEVLRGPQGTLYGKNVVGGAINMITRRPTEVFEARGRVSIGDFNHRGFQAFVAGPLGENVFAQLSLNSNERDGYLESQVDEFPQFFPNTSQRMLDDIQQLDIDTEAVRAGLRFTPSERLELNFSADYSTLNQSGPSVYLVDGPAGRIRSGLIANYNERIRDNFVIDPGFSDRTIYGFMGRLDYDFDDFTFTSISAYRYSKADVNNGDTTDELTALLFSSPTAQVGDFTTPGDGNMFVDEGRQFSQELRLTSASGGEIDWVGGLYFLHEDNERDEAFDLGLNLHTGNGEFSRVIPVTQGLSEQNNQTTSYAVYGQATWRPTERLSLTAGARYTVDEKDFQIQSTAGGFLILESFDVESSDNWSALTPRFVVDYQATDDIFLYALVSNGFKSGGFQGSPPRQFIAETPYDEETAWLYEFGFRSDLLDDRLRLNVAAFYTDFQDLQIFQLLVPEDAPEGTPGVLVAQNASDAEIRGVELEFTLLPFDGLTLQGSYTYLDTQYVNFVAPEGFRTPGGTEPGDRDGNPLRNAPENSWNLLARYELDLPNGATFSIQGDIRHQDRAFQDPDVELVASLPPYTIVDARVSYLTADGRWEFSLWSRNLNNEDFFIHNFPLSGSGAATPGPPRMLGLSIDFNY